MPVEFVPPAHHVEWEEAKLGGGGGHLSSMSPFPGRTLVSLLQESQMATTGAQSLLLPLLLSPAGSAWR